MISQFVEPISRFTVVFTEHNRRWQQEKMGQIAVKRDNFSENIRQYVNDLNISNKIETEEIQFAIYFMYYLSVCVQKTNQLRVI